MVPFNCFRDIFPPNKFLEEGLMRITGLLTIAVFAFLMLAPSDATGQTRIKFARGRTSASLSGSLAGGGVRRYVLGASRGQRLSGNVSSRNGCVKFTEGSTDLSFTTDSGNNWISVTNYCRTPTSFVMTVSIN